MAKLSRRGRASAEKLEPGRAYAVQDALALLKQVSSVKFDESVEVAVNLGVDARKSDQQVRGSTVLPKGTGKTVRVAVFAQGENARAAEAAGADAVGHARGWPAGPHPRAAGPDAQPQGGHGHAGCQTGR